MEVIGGIIVLFLFSLPLLAIFLLLLCVSLRLLAWLCDGLAWLCEGLGKICEVLFERKGSTITPYASTWEPDGGGITCSAAATAQELSMPSVMGAVEQYICGTRDTSKE